MSDYDKELKALEQADFERLTTIIKCCKHIKNNFIAEWGDETMTLFFWKVAWARTSYQF